MARGAITADGCAVELYALLPPQGEAEIIHSAIAPGASVLDLGCGTGRIAHQLIALGHPVVAVDSSPEMLAHVRGAETVCAPIAELRLRRRFDTVLMASHLLNGLDAAELLAAVTRHLDRAGVLVAQIHPAAWFDTVRDSDGGLIGDVHVQMDGIRRQGDELHGTVRYSHGGDEWSQQFTARRLDESSLRRELDDLGLSFDRWLDDGHSWFSADATRPA